MIVSWDVVASAPVLAWGAYAWGSQAVAVAVARRAPRRRPVIALTFDDGPDPEHTPRVLDGLAAAGARGTFFLSGRGHLRERRLILEESQIR